MKARFAIGTQYRTLDARKALCTVIDIHRTYNSAGELVKLRYVATHDVMGQPIVDHDVCETTIARGNPVPRQAEVAS